MKKQKPPSRTASASHSSHSDLDIAESLLALALALRNLDLYAEVPEELKGPRSQLRTLIKKCLQQGRDAPLREAQELAAEEDGSAWQVLRAQIEELSENLVLRQGDGADLEVNAFVIPMFVRSVGGLRAEQCFQDENAFERLRESLQEAGLESRKASVVLVAHAYHLDEIDGIGYTRLARMVQEAHDAMTRRKTVAAQAIADSMSGWPENPFGPQDEAVELRFLLGFAQKRLDDPFYAIPAKEAAADRYFEARAQRFRQWAGQIVPVVKRCLVTDGRDIDIDFLYQDLFHSGTQTAIGEYRMLQLMSELQQALAEQGVAAERAQAVIGPLDDDASLLRVQLRVDDAVVAVADKPVAPGADTRDEAQDVRDALHTLGIRSLSLAAGFDDEGRPIGMRRFDKP